MKIANLNFTVRDGHRVTSIEQYDLQGPVLRELEQAILSVLERYMPMNTIPPDMAGGSPTADSAANLKEEVWKDQEEPDFVKLARSLGFHVVQF